MQKQPILYIALYSVHTDMLKNTVKACKNSLRKKYKAIRNNIGEYNCKEYSNRIAEELFSSEFYVNSDIILAYASIGDEVETYSIINHALQHGKKIALPYCIPNTRNMKFYYINSISELKKGSFGVLEPDPNSCEEYKGDKATILVPALAFDKDGFRMGYGKGYYDRFLSSFTGIKVGLCYSECISRCIFRNWYDEQVDYIITDNFTKFIAKS